MKKTNILLAGVAIMLAAYTATAVEKTSGILTPMPQKSLLVGEKHVCSLNDPPHPADTYPSRAMQPEKETHSSPLKTAPEGSIFFEALNTEADFNRFIVIDANKDGKTWEYVSYYTAPRLSCHDSNRSDDWLITPPVSLKKGKLYKFTVDLRLSSKNSPEEYFEVKAGTAPTVEAMTIPVIQETKIPFPGYDQNSQIPYTTFSGFISATADTQYHIGLHGISQPDAWGFYAIRFTVYEGVEAAGPDNVIDMKAISAPNGEYRAEISFRAPETNTLGEEITEISSISLSRNDSVIRQIMSPLPGSLIQIHDTLPSNGTYTYRAVATNAMGEGKPSEVSVYVGTGQPAPPSFVTLTETETEGKVRLTWGAVTTDTASNPIDSSKITYTIGKITPQGNLADIVEGLTATEQIFQAVEHGKQELLQYAVLAKTEGGYSTGVSSEAISAGTPYTIPWKESFPDGTLSSIMGTKTITGQCQWSLSRDESFQNMHSADGDNGYVSFWSTKTGDQARLYTGKFRIDGMENPAISFYIYKRTTGTPDIGTIDVEADAGSGFRTITTVTAEPYPLPGWNKVFVRIPDEYKGQVIRLGFKATNVTYTYQFLDALAIEDMKSDNIAAVGIDAPLWAEPGKDFPITVTYSNNGMRRAQNYSIILRRDGNAVQTLPGQPLEPGTSASISFIENLDSSAGTEPVYTASVDFDADADDSDNNTSPVIVRNLISGYPVPTGLCASATGPGNISLQWMAPHFSSQRPEPVTDDFERYPSFATWIAGEWTFADLDKGKIGGLNDGQQEIILPGISINSRQAWWVMDRSVSSISSKSAFQAYSGQKYLAQQYITGGAPCDDWAVSPEICAEPQTISFYAKSFSADDPESLEILVSEGSRKPEDFRSVKKISEIPSQWSRYAVDLPQGSRRFALRCVSDYKFMLFIDDVSYIPAGNTGLQLIGYNVYRDGIRLNDTPVPLNSFSDTSVSDGQRSVYRVSAVYNKGESPVSEECIFDPSGVTLPDIRTVEVQASDSQITVTGAQGLQLTVVSADGKIVHHAKARSRDTIRVAPGIYLVKAGASTFKTVVL